MSPATRHATAPFTIEADRLHGPVVEWYAENRRDLPWRLPGTTPWAVLVSEVMLAQTPVARVVPAYLGWLARWPGPAELASAPVGEAVREWGSLGYPRRALWLHAAATQVIAHHQGVVPRAEESLRALPGVGEYTAAAVRAFAFGQRVPVLDVNVRRVLARLLSGVDRPGASVTVAERARAADLLPADPATAATWSVAVMELGALVCRAAAPRCEACPVSAGCAWLAAGRPRDVSARRSQRWHGTDRQCRGRLLAALRDAAAPVPASTLDAVWRDAVQRRRALDSLVADGLIDPLPDGRYALPGDPTVETDGVGTQGVEAGTVTTATEETAAVETRGLERAG